MCKVAQDKPEIVESIPSACADETYAVEFLEDMRWGDTPCCPRCGDIEVYQMKDRKTGERNRRFLWRCRGCNQQFTVRIGTVFEDSRIPLRYWCHAFWRACSSKKGVSALQIKRETGVTYKSALFMMHRVRFAMAPTDGGPMLKGVVEIDETYVGGKPRFKNHGRTGRGTAKQPVIGMVERSGEVRTRVIPDVTGKTLKSAIDSHVCKSSRIMTDEWRAYRRVGREFKGGHSIINHSMKEYVRGDVSTNTIESFFAILKRGIIGTYHNVSRKHLQRYLDEFEFKYNTRKVDDGERTRRAIQGAVGKRLTYADPTG